MELRKDHTDDHRTHLICMQKVLHLIFLQVLSNVLCDKAHGCTKGWFGGIHNDTVELFLIVCVTV